LVPHVQQLNAAPIYEYDWVGGMPGYSGKIFLNASSSALASDGGTIYDVLPGTYVSTPYGTYSDYSLAFSGAYFTSLQWNQSSITLMMLFFNAGQLDGAVALSHADLASNAIEGGSYPSNGGFSSPISEQDQSGQWLAVSVPEPNVPSLAAFGLAALIFNRLRQRRSASC